MLKSFTCPITIKNRELLSKDTNREMEKKTRK